jgi:hypothetical protein
MGNVWGIANPVGLPATYNPTGDINCPAGVSTTVITTGPLAALNPGDYYPYAVVMCGFLLGGTPPTNLRVNLNMGGGALDWFDWNVGLLAAAAPLFGTVVLVGPNSGSAWVGPGSTINIGVNPTGQAVTFKLLGSGARIALYRGPDA